MTDKVDGGGPCGSTRSETHEWRYAVMYQVNPPPPKIQGAPQEPPRVFARYYCVYCLDERDKEVPMPVHAPLVINNLIAQPAPDPLRRLN